LAGTEVQRTNFENLRVYQLAEALEDAVWDMVALWGPLAKDTVGRQLIRAADSVGANIAEGSGRGRVLDNRRFVRVSRGSLYETKHWLRRAYKRKLLTSEQTDSLKHTIAELTRTLNGSLRSLQTKESEPRA
jgi:four helix bundle protein